MHRAQVLMAGANLQVINHELETKFIVNDLNNILQVVALAPANPEATAALAAQQAAEEKEYQRLKAELETWCQGTALTCFVATVIFYSKVTCCLSSGLIKIMPGLSMTCIFLSCQSDCTPMQSHGATVWRSYMAFHMKSCKGQ